MKFTERYIDDFFKNLEKGIFRGQRCRDCGAYRLYPMPICGECQSSNLEFVELGKRGKLLYFTLSMVPPGKFGTKGPAYFGFIQFPEGYTVYCLTEGLDIKRPEVEFGNLPLEVEMTTKELGGSYVPVAVVKR
jgi:uncharacterized OB-fold protein